MKRIKMLVIAFLLAIALFTPAGVIIAGNASVAQAATIGINTKSITLEIGKTYKLKLNRTTKKPTWSSGRKSVATVSSYGTVTAKTVGKATITATLNGKKYYCTVTVKEPLKISKTSLSLEKGTSSTLKVTGNVKSPTWYTSNKSVATVTSTGKITAKALGTATITAYVDGKKLYCKLTVKTPIVISKSTLSLEKSSTYKLKITGSTKTVTWTTSNSSVATVSSYGTVTAKAAGTATITASVDGKKLTCKVTITAPIAISKTTLTLEEGKTYKLAITGTTKTVTWSSGYSPVASVSKYGTVTAIAEGTTVISGSVDGKNYSCTVTVKPFVNPNLAAAPFEAEELKTRNFSFVIPKGWKYEFDSPITELNTIALYPGDSDDNTIITIDIVNTGTSMPDYSDVKDFFLMMNSEAFTLDLLKLGYNDDTISISDFTQKDFTIDKGTGLVTSYTVASENEISTLSQSVYDIYIDNYFMEVNASSISGTYDMQTILDYLMKSMIVK
ncbi:MAG: hypothetical protein K0S76_964 [Herbinix sp.]|jgi:uncharacterized protein YjdB|nr:hypothetical protein [Herbinix sp.]